MHAMAHILLQGFENRYNSYGRYPGSLIAGRRAAASSPPSRHILAAFTKATNGVRGQIYDLLGKLDVIVTTGFSGTQDQWYETLGDHRLVLCPRGNGLDTHRVWETLYVGRIPVVAASAMDAVFERLPVIILGSWDELSNTAVLAQGESAIIAGMANGAFDLRRLRLEYYACLIMAAVGRVTPGALALNFSCGF